MNRVVITGMGIVSPNGIGLNKFTDSLKNGVSGITFQSTLVDANFTCQIAGIPNIDNSVFTDLFQKFNVQNASLNLKYALLACSEAWTDAGLVFPELGEATLDINSGIIIGSSIGNIDVLKNTIFPLIDAKTPRKLRSDSIPNSMFNSASAYLAGFLGLGNYIGAVSSACSTGTESIINGFERIRYGKAKRMIVGSTEIPSLYIWGGFDSMRILSKNYNKFPDKGSRPLSATAEGFVPAAGCGILILEDIELAKYRNAKIYGEIIGGHVNSGGQLNGGSMQAPSAEGIQRCIKTAIEEASIHSSKIDFISGHLSSTMADPLEVKNWCLALDRFNSDFPYINSSKSLIGHCIGAAGSIETIAGIIQMNHSFIHESANCEDLHPMVSELIDPEKIPQQTIKNVNIDIFAKASFGFGDTNACLIIRKYKSQ